MCVWVLGVYLSVCVSWSVNACGLTGPWYFDLLALGLASALFAVVFFWLKGLINMQMIVCTSGRARGRERLALRLLFDCLIKTPHG